jgi:hypothetical protein
LVKKRILVGNPEGKKWRLGRSNRGKGILLKQRLNNYCVTVWTNYGTHKRLRWSRCSVLAFNARVFRVEKILSTPSFVSEVKPAVPCRRFPACKRSLNVTWKSAFMQNSRILFSPIKFHVSLLGSLASRRTWRHLAGTMGTFKTRGNRVVQQA